MWRICSSQEVSAEGANSRSGPRLARAVPASRRKSSSNRLRWRSRAARRARCLAIALVRIIVLLGPASMPGLRSVEVDADGASSRSPHRWPRRSLPASSLRSAYADAAGELARRPIRWLGSRRDRAQQALAIGQIGLAVALLVTASLLVESFRQLRSVDPGFQPSQVTTAKLTLAASRYPDAVSRTRFVDQILANLTELPASNRPDYRCGTDRRQPAGDELRASGWRRGRSDRIAKRERRLGDGRLLRIAGRAAHLRHVPHGRGCGRPRSRRHHQSACSRGRSLATRSIGRQVRSGPRRRRPFR